jgi:hypothetical protein
VTATNPSINGDLTSGLFSPAASVVAVATGGVQQMTVNSSGYVGIGSTSPRAILDLSGNTGAMILPIGTTGQEPSTPVNGMIRYNSTYPDVEAYIGNVWTTLTTGGDSAAIYLGTSAGTANPQIGGAPSYGFYTADGSTKVDVAINGAKTAEWTSAGEAITGVLTVSSTVTVGGIAILSAPSSAILHLGAADAASPIAQTLGVQNVVAGTSNTAGADFKIVGSQGTGTGAGGRILFETAAAGGSGTSQNALTTPMYITPTGGGGIIVPNISAGVPETAGANVGMHNGNGQLVISSGGSDVASIGTYGNTFGASFGLSIPPTGFIGWSSSGTPEGGSFPPDTYLGRQGAANIQLGGFDAFGAATAQAFGPQGVHPGGGRTNLAGANWTIYGSRGLGNAAGGDIIFQTALPGASGGTQNALVTAVQISGTTGYVGFGTAAPAEPLEIYSSGSGVLLQLAGSSGTCNHTPGSSSETVSCSSDARLKSEPIDTPSALSWLSSIRVRDYTWKKTGQKRTGVIAQELQKTHPEMVTYDKTKDQWTVEQPNPWTLVKILQEQQAEIDNLKKQLATKH